MADAPRENTEDHFVAWLLRYQGDVYRYIVSLLPNLSEADDVFQHTCLILWRRQDGIQSSEHFARMAYKIAFNEVRNARRRLGKRGKMFSEPLLEVLAADSQNTSATEESRQDALQHCLKKLASRSYLLVQQYYRGEDTAVEISERLGISVPALRMKVHRIRRRLATCIEHQIRVQEP